MTDPLMPPSWQPPSWQPPTGGPPPPPPPGYLQGYGYQQGYGYPQPYGYQPYAAAPKPGIIPLRPLAVGEILDGAFATIRRHPGTVLGVSAAVACVQQALVLLVRLASGTLTQTQSIHFTDDGSSTSQANVAGAYASLGAVTLIATLIGTLLTGVLCLIVSDSILGQPTSVRAAWTRLRPQAWKLVVVSVAATIGESIALAVCIAPGVFLWGMWAVVVPALVLERTTISGAFSRSWRLAKGSFWRVWGIRALGWIIAHVFGGIVGAIAGASTLNDIFASSSTGTIHISTLTIVLGAVLGVVATTLTAPFQSGVLTLLYVDRRIRAEALDVQLQQAAAVPITTFG